MSIIRTDKRVTATFGEGDIVTAPVGPRNQLPDSLVIVLSQPNVEFDGKDINEFDEVIMLTFKRGASVDKLIEQLRTLRKNFGEDPTEATEPMRPMQVLTMFLQNVVQAGSVDMELRLKAAGLLAALERAG